METKSIADIYMLTDYKTRNESASIFRVNSTEQVPPDKAMHCYNSKSALNNTTNWQENKFHMSHFSPPKQRPEERLNQTSRVTSCCTRKKIVDSIAEEAIPDELGDGNCAGNGRPMPATNFNESRFLRKKKKASCISKPTSCMVLPGESTNRTSNTKHVQYVKAVPKKPADSSPKKPPLYPVPQPQYSTASNTPKSPVQQSPRIAPERTIIREGYLLKASSGLITKWSYKYCVLYSDKVFAYYNRKEDAKLKGCINFKLVSSDVIVPSLKDPKYFKIRVAGSSKLFQFRDESVANTRFWLELILRCSSNTNCIPTSVTYLPYRDSRFWKVF